MISSSGVRHRPRFGEITACSRTAWADHAQTGSRENRDRGGATMILPGETEAGSAGKQPCRGIVRGAHRDNERSAEDSLLRFSKDHIGSVDPDALKIPARRAEYSLAESALSTLPAEPTHHPGDNTLTLLSDAVNSCPLQDGDDQTYSASQSVRVNHTVFVAARKDRQRLITVGTAANVCRMIATERRIRDPMSQAETLVWPYNAQQSVSVSKPSSP
jgi:hypothetical protein